MVLWKSLGSILLVLSLLLVACGDDDDPSPADAQASLCEDLDALESEMTTLTGMSAESSIEDLKEQRDQVNDAFDAVVDSAGDVQDVETDNLEQAFEELDEAVDEIGDDMPIADAQASMQNEVADVQAAWTELRTTAACP